MLSVGYANGSRLNILLHYKGLPHMMDNVITH
jgi:hypothetical protein